MRHSVFKILSREKRREERERRGEERREGEEERVPVGQVGNSITVPKEARMMEKEGMTDERERAVMYESASYGCLSLVLLAKERKKEKERIRKRKKKKERKEGRKRKKKKEKKEKI
jgi:hypothetical protein